MSFFSPRFGRVGSAVEADRLAALDSLGLSARPDPALDLLAGVVARQLAVPIVLVSLLNSEWEYFPGYAGPDTPFADSRKLPLTHSICRHVIDRQGPLVISDARLDPLVADNQAVADLGVIAYLGMPLIDLNDHYLGALCAVDFKRRAWTAAEIELMASLAVSCSHSLQRRETRDIDALVSQGPADGAPVQSSRVEHQLRYLVDTSPALLGYWDRELHNVIANKQYVEWFGKKPIEIAGRHLRDVVGYQLYRENLAPIEAVLRGEANTFHRTLVDAHGKTRHTLTSYLPDRAADGATDGFFEHGADVTEILQTLQFRDAVLAAIPDLIFVRELHTETVVWFSTSPAEHLDNSDEVLAAEDGELRHTVLHPDDLQLVLDADRSAYRLGDGETLQACCRVLHADGQYRWKLRRTTPFQRDASGQVRQILGITRDIHDSVELTERLEAAAVTDALTDLPNRRLLSDRLALALKRQSRTGVPVAVLYCDLDSFKRVNELGGHPPVMKCSE